MFLLFHLKMEGQECTDSTHDMYIGLRPTTLSNKHELTKKKSAGDDDDKN